MSEQEKITWIELPCRECGSWVEVHNIEVWDGLCPECAEVDQ